MLDSGRRISSFELKLQIIIFDRNFLDEISYEVVDWLRDEEAKYQADILAKEVRSYASESVPSPDAIKAALEASAKKGKAGGKSMFKIYHIKPSIKTIILETSPGRSASASPDSGNSTDEERTIRDDYVHPTSLKAWKQKKDKEVQEQEQQTKAKRPPSGNKSPKPKSPRAAEKAAKSPTPGEKSPKGAKGKRAASAAASETSVVRTTSIYRS